MSKPLTWEEMDSMIINGILAYEPYGSFYSSDNDGSLMSCAMSATSDQPSPLDSDDWGVIDLGLVSDDERIVLEQFDNYLSLRAVMGGDEVCMD